MTTKKSTPSVFKEKITITQPYTKIYLICISKTTIPTRKENLNHLKQNHNVVYTEARMPTSSLLLV